LLEHVGLDKTGEGRNALGHTDGIGYLLAALNQLVLPPLAQLLNKKLASTRPQIASTSCRGWAYRLSARSIEPAMLLQSGL